MANTTNFGWETPDDTDLVKDGAAAMRTLGNSIDASFVDLKGGTTGQVLAKASNTDLDFTWASDASGIPATIFDAKGDLIAATAADTAARLAVGTNGHVLTADSTAATGLKWAAVATTKNFTLLNSGGTALTGAATITVSSLSGYDQFYVVVTGGSAGASSTITLRFNSDTAANYDGFGAKFTAGSTYAATTMVTHFNNAGDTSYTLVVASSNAASLFSGGFSVSGANTSGIKMIQSQMASTAQGGADQTAYVTQGLYKGTSVISSISLISGTGNFDAGTLYIYGAV